FPVMESSGVTTVQGYAIFSVAPQKRVNCAPGNLDRRLYLRRVALIHLTVLAAFLFIAHLDWAHAQTSKRDDAKPVAAVYDPDVNHLWNRLFVAFYQQRITNSTHASENPGEAHWIGPDVLDPPIGYHPKFLLDNEPFTRCNALLDQFLNRDG